MSERAEMIQIRCTENEFRRWKMAKAAIDPNGSQADALMKILDVYDSNPALFTPEYR